MPKECCKKTYAKVPEDEPIFILRGQDALAVEVIKTWLGAAFMAGVSQEKRTQAAEHVKDFEAWAATHKTKLPD